MKEVYVGGEYSEFEEYRQIVTQAILEMGMMPIIVEGRMFGQKLKSSILDQLSRSDICLIVVGFRYGAILPDSDVSITEMEYRWARERDMPCLLFFMRDDHPLLQEHRNRNPEDYELLQRFRSEILRNYVVGVFDSPQDLKAKVLVSLSRLQAKREYNIHGASVSRDLIINQIDENVLQDIIIRSIELYQARIQQDPTRVNSDDPDAVTVKPAFGRISRSENYQCDVFVIMPFDKEYVDVYEDIIKPVVEERLKLVAKRGDDESFRSNHHIMDEVWFGLYNCSVVVADCTGSNPNVFYELGIAHTLGKPVVMIAQDVDNAPFDVRGRRFIPYEDSIKGKRKLEDELETTIRNLLNQSQE